VATLVPTENPRRRSKD